VILLELLLQIHRLDHATCAPLGEIMALLNFRLVGDRRGSLTGVF